MTVYLGGTEGGRPCTHCTHCTHCANCVLFGSLARYLIHEHGWRRAFLVLGLVDFAGLCLPALFLVPPPPPPRRSRRRRGKTKEERKEEGQVGAQEGGQRDRAKGEKMAELPPQPAAPEMGKVQGAVAVQGAAAVQRAAGGVAGAAARGGSAGGGGAPSAFSLRAVLGFGPDPLAIAHYRRLRFFAAAVVAHRYKGRRALQRWAHRCKGRRALQRWAHR